MSKTSSPVGEKLQKALADLGQGSRRSMETAISEGRVMVNGTVAHVGARVIPTDQIKLDGRILKRSDAADFCRVLVYNKPEGEVSTRQDEQGRATVFDRLPRLQNGRWIAVGRLDINTSGLLLFTNDGELANRLMHPSRQIEREYAVRVFGEVPKGAQRRLLNGVELEDGKAKFTRVHARKSQEDSLNCWFDVTLEEGRNREVRRLWESQDVTVSRLIRLRYGPIMLPKRLPQGGWLELELDKVNLLREFVDLPAESQSKITEKENQLDHVRLSRMRRSVKKNKVKRKHHQRRSI